MVFSLYLNYILYITKNELMYMVIIVDDFDDDDDDGDFIVVPPFFEIETESESKTTKKITNSKN